jgi:putative phosphoesterase
MEKRKALIMSDNHGDLQVIDTVIQGNAADAIFHCGDWCERLERLPRGVHLVRGNCDDDPRIPEERIVPWGMFRILVVHGHRYQVKNSLLSLKYKAEEVGANLILFGHSHQPLCIQDGEKIFLNPGSLIHPRGYPRATYAVMEWEQVSRFDGVLKVTYYNIAGQKEEPLSTSFCIHLPRDND